MDGDIFRIYRDVESRERKNVFNRWLLDNCKRAASYEALRTMCVGREKEINRCIDKIRGKK